MFKRFKILILLIQVCIGKPQQPPQITQQQPAFSAQNTQLAQVPQAAAQPLQPVMSTAPSTNPQGIIDIIRQSAWYIRQTIINWMNYKMQLCNQMRQTWKAMYPNSQGGASTTVSFPVPNDPQITPSFYPPPPPPQLQGRPFQVIPFKIPGSNEQHWFYELIQDQQPAATPQQPLPQFQQPGAPLQQPLPQAQQQGAPLQQPVPQVQQQGAPLQQPLPQVQQQGAPLQQPLPQVQQQGTPLQQPLPQVQQQGAPLQQPLPQVQQPGSPLQQPLPQGQQPGAPLQQPGAPLQQPWPQAQQQGPPAQQPLPQGQQPAAQAQQPLAQGQQAVAPPQLQPAPGMPIATPLPDQPPSVIG